MGFFDRAREGSGENQADWPATLQVLEHRLSGAGDELFSSTLSVNEFAVLEQLGPRPISTVQGTSVHQVGWQSLPEDAQARQVDVFHQLHAIGRAWGEARNLACDRLRYEAELVGADAVVGVRLQRGTHDWGRRAVDFMVIGTAVRTPGAVTGSTPILSDLSIQDHWKLANGGWSPAGLLVATVAFFISPGAVTRRQRRRSLLSSQERWEYSDGFSAARHAVVADIRRQARELGADGIVGITLDHQITAGRFMVQMSNRSGTATSTGTMLIGHLTPTGASDERSGVVVTFHCAGTAIRRVPQAGDHGFRPERVLSVGGRI